MYLMQFSSYRDFTICIIRILSCLGSQDKKKLYDKITKKCIYDFITSNIKVAIIYLSNSYL